MQRTAKFSPDKLHRLFLGRTWDQDLSKIVFIGLNPSKADDTQDDNTVRRMIRFTEDWGFGGFYLCNLYTYISTDPKLMVKWYQSLSPHKLKLHERENLKFIKSRAEVCSVVVFCWGAGAPEEDGPQNAIIRTFPEARCFGKTQNGHPKHPLFLPSHLQLTRFRKPPQRSALLGGK